MLVYQKGPFLEKMSLSKEAVSHIKARRLKIGDGISLCNGEGLVAQCSLVELSRNQAVCQLEALSQKEKSAFPRLVVGITKLPTIEFILQKVTEIGVSEIILLRCEYTPIAFDQDVFDKKRDRWEKIIISACEQSEMYYKPNLSWMHFSDYVKMDCLKYMFHPGGNPVELIQGADLMVGPEGGWSEKELQSNIQMVGLNTGVLRADTACMAALLTHRMNL